MVAAKTASSWHSVFLELVDFSCVIVLHIAWPRSMLCGSYGTWWWRYGMHGVGEARGSKVFKESISNGLRMLRECKEAGVLGVTRLTVQCPPPGLYNLWLHTVAAVEQFSTKRNQTLIWIWQPPEPSCEEKSYYSSEWHNRPSWYTFLIEHDWVRHDTLIDMWFYGRGKWWWVWGWRCGSYMGARWISGGA